MMHDSLLNFHSVFFETPCINSPKRKFENYIIAAEGSTLFLTICFSLASSFPAELCIAERQLDFGGGRTDFQIYDVF